MLKIFFISFIVFFNIHYASAEDFIYEDNLGRTVTIKTPAKRVVSLITYETILTLNSMDSLVGIGRWAYDNPFINAVKPDIKKIPSPGSATDVNMELLLKLNPDLVITWTIREDVVRFLESKNVKVIAVLPESIDELYDLIRVHGRIFGKKQRAEEVIAEMKKVFQLIEKRVSKVSPKKKVLWVYSKATSVNGGQGAVADLMKIINVENPASHIPTRNYSTSIEEIIKWNPDAMFVWWGNTEFSIKDLLDSPQWRVVRAVKDGKIFKSPEWSTVSPAIAVTALWMAMKIYPEQFKDIDFEKTANNFFQKVYTTPYKKSWFELR